MCLPLWNFGKHEEGTGTVPLRNPAIFFNPVNHGSDNRGGIRTDRLCVPAQERVADGIYFLRVSEESDDGRSFVITKRIIIEN